jgi:antirestriction protein
VSTRPRICVVSLTDLSEREILVGEWMDADLDIAELTRRVNAVLARSPTGGCLQWSIWDYDGFAGLAIAESEPLETISRLAKGIRAHGAAFAAWAAVAGRQPAKLDRFTSAFLGSYDRRSDYAAKVLDAARVRDAARSAVPPTVAGYVCIDLAGYVTDLELYGRIAIVERPDGGVWIFDAEP